MARGLRRERPTLGGLVALRYSAQSLSAPTKSASFDAGAAAEGAAIDTLKVAKRLREAGFTEPQAEAVIAAVQESAEGAEFATKADLKAEIAVLRAEIREVELRLEARIEALKSEILSRVFGMILGSLVVNIIAIVGAMFAVAKLVPH